MSASNHLKRYPYARSSTVAYLIKRDEKLSQLRNEIRRQKKPTYAVVRLIKAVGEAFRSAMKQP